MDDQAIGIISIAVTLMSGILVLLLTKLFEWLSDRKNKRVIPSIAVWNNGRDDIDSRLKNNALRWFINIDRIDDYIGTRFLYLVVRSENKFKMSECKVITRCMYQDELNIEEIYNREYKIGLIISSFGSVFPIPVPHKGRMNIHCEITYKTEKNQRMQYIFEAQVDPVNKTFRRIEDYSMLLKKQRSNIADRHNTEKPSCVRGKHVRRYNLNMSDCFTSGEVKQKLSGSKSLNYNW